MNDGEPWFLTWATASDFENHFVITGKTEYRKERYDGNY
jgi:hypothetical protein